MFFSATDEKSNAASELTSIPGCMGCKMSVRESRGRRMAKRRGYRLVKSRSRDPQAVDYDLYAVIDVRTNAAVNPPIAGRWLCSWSLEEVEDYLTYDLPADASDTQ